MEGPHTCLQFLEAYLKRSYGIRDFCPEINKPPNVNSHSQLKISAASELCLRYLNKDGTCFLIFETAPK